jgi:TetR/AcrR family transcriptional repressor of nem operon
MSSTKEQITLLADELMRSKGYNAFSYSDISKPLGIKNAAVHYHFPTKPDLALEIVKYHSDSFDRFTERVEEKEALSKIKFFLNFYTSIQLSGRICVIGAFATDWNAMNEEIQHAMSGFTSNVIEWITFTLKEGHSNNTIHLSDSAESEALSILTNIFAATQLSRITGSDHFAAIKQNILTRITH